MKAAASPLCVFGDESRARILIALLAGPLHLRALCRAAGIGYRSTWNMVTDLIAEGALAESERSSQSLRRIVGLNREFVAAPELKRVLEKLAEFAQPPVGQEPRKHHVWNMKGANNSKIRALFGSAERTRALLHIASAVVTTSRDLQTSLHQSEQGVVQSLRLFEQIGIITRYRQGKCLAICFNRDYFCGAELLALCRKIAVVFPEIGVRARALGLSGQKHMRIPRQSHVVRRMPFIRPSYVLAIMALGAGPQSTAYVAEQTGVGIQSARKTLKRLSQLGISSLVKDPSGNFQACLTAESPIAAPLFELIAKLSGRSIALYNTNQTKQAPAVIDSEQLLYPRYAAIFSQIGSGNSELSCYSASVLTRMHKTLSRAGLVERYTHDNLEFVLHKGFVAVSALRKLCEALQKN